MFKYIRKIIEIMGMLQIRIWVTIIATLTAVIFIGLSRFYPNNATLFLSIEVIILPAIYIIGNYYAEEVIKKEYSDLMKELEDKTEKLNSELVEEKISNRELTTILDMSLGVEDGNKKKK